MAKTKTSVQLELTVQRRVAAGTRPARRLRQQGVIPGVVYGRDTEPIPVTMNHREFVKVLHSKAGEHALVTLRMGDGKPWEKPAIVQAVQHDPVDGHVIHVDFHAILLTEQLKVKVPIVLKGEPVGVKQEGGILEHFLREIEVECLPTEIPAKVEHDVSAMKVGTTLHVRDLEAPKNARITSDLEGVIAAIKTPKAEKPEEEAAAITEPEVIREKKEEAEETAGAEVKGEQKPAVRPGAAEARAGEAKKEAK